MNCPDCGGTIVFPEGFNGEAVCSACGLVANEPLSLQIRGQWQPKWLSNWDEGDSETLKEWLTILRTISCQLNLPSFPYREEAARIIRVKSQALLKSQRFGKNKREAITALIYIILKKYNRMRSLKELCQTLNLDHSQVAKYVWAMYEIIETRPQTHIHPPAHVHETIPVHYLRTFAWNFTNDSQLIRTAETLLQRIHRGIGGNPISLAAGALYHVCKNQTAYVSKNKIAKAFNISSRTVYNSERKIRTILEQKTLQPLNQQLNDFSSFSQNSMGKF